MKIGVAINITGVSQINRILEVLPSKVQRKVVSSSMRDGLKIIAAEVRSQVPVDKGLTRSAVKTRVVKQKRGRPPMLEVQISGKVEGLVKKPKNGKAAFYPAVVEFGDKNTPANPFMRRSYEAKAEAAKQTTMASLARGVEREALK